MDKFEKAITLIDKRNAEDPNTRIYEGKVYPAELLYSERMSQKLLEFRPDASDELQIAARAQHICRWKYPRDSYPMDRAGYLRWREELKTIHADLTSNILKEVGYEEEFINRVSFLIKKKLIKKDEESQTLEDVICLVFLQFYFEEFAEKHEDEKVISIIRKTWQKMSAEGHNAALKLPLNQKTRNLVKQALA